jgi:hypothetical protein
VIILAVALIIHPAFGGRSETRTGPRVRLWCVTQDSNGSAFWRVTHTRPPSIFHTPRPPPLLIPLAGLCAALAMNYAEDRLDRRARADKAGATVANEIIADLEKAHDVFKIHCGTSLTEVPASTKDVDSILQLIDAHELAGRTLRDCGQIRQSVFHFGMAWRFCHLLEKQHHNDNSNEIKNEWKAVGDYAQIAEIAGYPEIGILALLYYRCRGSLDPLISTDEDNQQVTSTGCGCGMAMCGAAPCFLAFPSESTLLEEIIDAFEELNRNASASTFESYVSAHDILGQLALFSRSNSPQEMHFQDMHNFLKNKMPIAQPMLQFWDTQMETSSMYQKLPTVNMFLLLKLLFSSPAGGSLLKLSCISIPYLSILLPPSSKEGKRMAKEYKSHNAYFVFIRSLVLGERMKKHRVGKVVHHTPVWDTVFGLLHESEDDAFVSRNDGKEEISLSYYLKTVIRGCGSNECHDLPQIPQSILPHTPIYVVGDSHVLSLAWQTLHINDTVSNIHTLRTATPFPATGVKAFHLRSYTQFFTHYNLHACLRRLPNHDSNQKRTIILSAGEIDCREGIGGTLLKGYFRSCNEAVEDTVRKYLNAASEIALQYNLQILIMPVAPHAYRSEKNGKSVGRAKRRETMFWWNKVLRSELQSSKFANVFLLDYEERLRYPDQKSPVGYVLNPCFNADYTHTNNAIVPLVAEAIQNSGCDLKYL